MVKQLSRVARSCSAGQIIALCLILLFFSVNVAQAGYYFPPPGQTLSQQNQQPSQTVGLNQNLITALQDKASRWALWRHDYLVHVEGNFNQTAEVKSLRKTWHALTVGAVVKQGKIPDFKTEKSANTRQIYPEKTPMPPGNM